MAAGPCGGGHRMGFLPVQVICSDERGKVHPLRDAWRWFRWPRANWKYFHRHSETGFAI